MSVIRRVVLVGLALAVTTMLIAAGAAYWFFSGDGVRLALERQASEWLGQPVHIASATGQVFPRLGIQLREVRIGEPAQMTLAGVDVSTSLRALLSRRIEDADVIISDSRIDLPLSIGRPANLPGARDAARVPGSRAAASPPPVELVSVRTIALRDIAIGSRGREIVASADATLAGSELRLARFVASSERTRLEASGTVALGPRIEARLDVIASRLDLDELLALAGAFLPERTSRNERSARPSARVAAHITAEAARAASLDARKLSTDLTLEGERVALEPLRFELFGGTYEGVFQATLGDALDMRLTSSVAGLDVAQLAAFGGVPDTITGRLSGRGTFTGRGLDVGSMLQSARGSGSASIVAGSIKRLNLIRTVVLFFGRPEPDAPPGADTFDRIEATFSLAEGVFNAQEFSLRSPDADIDGRGTLSLASKALEGTADLRLSEALSKQAGTDLVRFTREENRVVLPARISGTLATPRITIDAAAAARRGLKNETERRLRDLFDVR
ncbi:MAG: AsmA-like C-terminal region-containing protein [Vicinamibacterales bacterium]